MAGLLQRLAVAALLALQVSASSSSFLSTHSLTDPEAVKRLFQLPFFPQLSAQQIVAQGLLPPSYKLSPPSPGKKVPRVIWVAVGNASEELPGPLREFFQRNSGWQVNVIGNDDKDAFIDGVFANTSVQLAYHLISPLLGAAKADIWRYAVLQLFGGVYIDYDSDIKVPLDTVVEAEDTLIVSEEGSNFHECYIPSYPLSNNHTFSKFGRGVGPSPSGAFSATANPYVAAAPHAESGLPVFFDGKFIVQWAIIAAPGNALFHRTLANLVDLLYRDYFRETVVLLHRHTHRMLQLLCTTNYVFTSSLRQLLLESGVRGEALVRPRVLHDDWKEYKGKCKAIWTGNDPHHYRKIMRPGHKGHDLLRAYCPPAAAALLAPAANALEGWAISAYAGGKQAVFVVEGGARRSVPDMDTFAALGLAADKVLHVPDVVFALLKEGPPLKPIAPPAR